MNLPPTDWMCLPRQLWRNSSLLCWLSHKDLTFVAPGSRTSLGPNKNPLGLSSKVPNITFAFGDLPCLCVEAASTSPRQSRVTWETWDTCRRVPRSGSHNGRVEAWSVAWGRLGQLACLTRSSLCELPFLQCLQHAVSRRPSLRFTRCCEAARITLMAMAGGSFVNDV